MTGPYILAGQPPRPMRGPIFAAYLSNTTLRVEQPNSGAGDAGPELLTLGGLYDPRLDPIYINGSSADADVRRAELARLSDPNDPWAFSDQILAPPGWTRGIAIGQVFVQGPAVILYPPASPEAGSEPPSGGPAGGAPPNYIDPVVEGAPMIDPADRPSSFDDFSQQLLRRVAANLGLSFEELEADMAAQDADFRACLSEIEGGRRFAARALSSQPHDVSLDLRQRSFQRFTHGVRRAVVFQWHRIKRQAAEVLHDLQRVLGAFGEKDRHGHRETFSCVDLPPLTEAGPDKVRQLLPLVPDQDAEALKPSLDAGDEVVGHVPSFPGEFCIPKEARPVESRPQRFGGAGEGAR